MVLAALIPSALAATTVVAPGEDWCDVVNAAAPGDTVVLQAGEHAGPCTITTSGTDGAPVSLRGEDPADPPQIVYTGASSNVIDVLADHVSITGLAFGPTRPDIDGIKIKSGSWITVEGNTFTGMGGIAVSANAADSTGITILRNRFTDLQATGMYLGCHDGAASCVAADLRIEGNVIDGVTSDDVGYGLEIKKDSWGVVQDNVIHDTQGPGIEVFGSEDAAAASRVDGNLVVRARNNASIEVGGPYVTVTNNVVIGGGDGGINVYPYWDSVHDVVISGNTVVGEGAPAVRVSDRATAIRLTDNAGYQEVGDGPFPAATVELSLAGNVACSAPEDCWVDGVAWDFGPVDGSALTTAGTAVAELTVDFCGRARGAVPTVGALEVGHPGEPGPLGIDFKSSFSCGEGPGDSGTTDSGPTDPGTTDSGPTDTSSPTDSDGPGLDDTGTGGSKPACGCASGGAGSGWLGLTLAGLLARRRVRG